MTRVQITYLGQSGFLLDNGTSKLLIDPRNKKSGDVDGDVIYVTHRHTDHTGGVETFLKRNPDAELICNEQVANKFSKWTERTILAIPGEELEQGPWKLKFFNFRHGFFRGEMNTGVIVNLPGLVFGHLGDAVEFKAFYNEKLDVLATPIGSMFAASPKKALEELKNFTVPLPVIIPMHWILRNPGKFCEKLGEKLDCRCVVPEDGKTVNWY